jgi:type II secretory pathway predicted ATPase ExeA
MNTPHDLLNHFGLSRIPFTILPHDPLWLDDHRKLILSRLQGTLRTGGFTVVHGKSGCGKTRIVHALQQSLNPNLYQSVHISHATLNQTGMLQTIAWKLGIEPAHTRPKNIRNIARHIQESRITPLVAFDELQSCAPATLEEIRLLCEIDFGPDRRIPVILIGTDEFPGALTMRQTHSLSQRIGQYLELRPIEAKDIHGYIRHHLQCAKGQTDLFSANALTRLAQLTGGIPRLIDNLARTALEFAAAQQAPSVELRHIDEAANLVFGPNARNEEIP